MAWDVEMAKEFKKRNNKSIDEPVIGVVTGINPIGISLFNNQVILKPDLIYISNSLSVYEGTCIVDGKSGTCTIDRSLQVGNKVLCVPTAKGQKWFIVEVVE
jgi:hypothetical protein